MSAHTEEEAKQCWCPFATMAEDHNAVNRFWADGQLTSGPKCLASGCMAWKWEPNLEPRPGGILEVIPSNKGTCKMMEQC